MATNAYSTIASGSSNPKPNRACRCLNIRLEVAEQQSQPISIAQNGPVAEVEAEAEEQQIGQYKLNGESSITVLLPHLTQREILSIDTDEDEDLEDVASQDMKASSTFAGRAALSLRCLICSSLVYAVARALPPGPTRSLGFSVPSQGNKSPAIGSSSASPSRSSQSPTFAPESLLQPADGNVWLLPGCALSSEEAIEQAIEQAKSSQGYSAVYGVILTNSTTVGMDIESLPPALPGSSKTSQSEVKIRSSRPSFETQRTSSFGPLHMSASTGLPALPSSLFDNLSSSSLSSPPRSPSVNANSHKSSLFSPTLQASTVTSLSGLDPLMAYLDSAGLDSLKKRRSDAENEIAAFIISKRKELEYHEQQARGQGEKLLSLRRAAQKNPKMTREGVTYKIRSRQVKSTPIQAATQDLRPQKNSVPVPAQPLQAEKASREIDESLLSSTLPSSAFERRAPLSPSRYSQSITTPPDTLSSAASSVSGDGMHFRPSSMSVTSQSLSALSASFAMRGREPPKELEAWAHKRRLMERYPEGDHSALNSAEPSGDERSEEDEGDGEEENVRGRGRGRDRDAINAAKEKQLRMERERERLAYAQGEGRSLPMTVGSQVRGGIPSAPGIQYIQSQQPKPANPVPNRPSQVSIESEQEVGTPKISQEPSSSAKGLNLGRGRSKRTESASPLRSADAEDAESVNSGSTAGEALPVTSASSSGAPFAPGSLSALGKAPAITSVDIGPSPDDKETPQALGILSAHSNDSSTPSADVILRARPLPEIENEGSKLKPAVKGTATNSASSVISATKKSKKGKTKTKKVAFAETTEKVEGASLSPEEENEAEAEEEEPKHLVDESEDAVFDIDEEVDRSEVGDSEEEESSSGHQALSDLASDPAAKARSSRMDESGDEISADSSDEDKELEVAASMASVGSLSALTNHLSAQKANTSSFAGDFDPASLRLDGRVVDAGISLTKRGVSASSHMASLIPMSEGSRMTDGPSGARIPMAIGEAEARLSGLLAPQAPSHRDLWSKSGAHAKKRSKYQLGAEDDEKWEAWQSRVRAQEAKAAENARSSPLSSSLGGTAAVPTFIRSNGPGFNKSSTTTIQDGTSGFDREPKTSLPYGEKLLVPSLRKAIRRTYSSTTKLSASSTLETIQDEDKAGNTAGASAISTAPRQDHSGTRSPPGRGALAGSVTTRGFVAKATSPAPPASSSEVPSPGAAQSPTPLLAAKPVGRRSPQPPYVAPPPPTSSSIVLEPNEADAPKPLDLFSVPVDASFQENEDGEEEEEDWEKVILFMHRLQRLKINKRTGWLHHRVKNPESISDHMYRMAILAMLCPATDVDIGKCVQLALVHDLAEAEVGDLTPLDNVTKAEKVEREKRAIEYFVHALLGDSPAGKRILALWMEYEERETKEAKLVKDLDRFELCLQAIEYERSDIITDLQPFWKTSIGHISHPRQRKWAVQLALEREQLWKSRGFEYQQIIKPEDSIAAKPQL